VLVQPALGDMSATAFQRWAYALDAGETAARSIAPALRRLAVDSATYRARRERRLAFGEPTERVDYVMVGAYSGRSPGSLLDRIATRPGPLDTATLTGDIRHLYSLGIYERVDYRIVETEDGNALVLRVREKPWGPSYLRFRLAISDRLGGEGTYSLAAHLLVPQMNSWGAELVADLEIGERRSVGVEYYQPLGVRGTFYVAPWTRYQSAPADVFVGDRTVARYRADFSTTGLETGIHLGLDTELAFSYERGAVTASRAIGPPSMEGFESQIGLARARLSVDGLDDPLFPQSGVAFYVEGQVSRDWLGADGQALGAISFGRWTLFGAALGATSFGSSLPEYARAGLGGFLLMSGYHPGEISGNHLIFGRAMIFREFGNDRLYAGLSLEAGNAWPTPEAIRLDDLRHSLAAALGFRTPLGPVYLGIGTRGAGTHLMYLEVGRSL
jgi:NTE family protein